MRGTVNVPHGVKKTLKLLNLETRYRATVISDNKINQGMLLKAKEHLAWTKADSKIIAQLLKNKGEKSKTIKRIKTTPKTIFSRNASSQAEQRMLSRVGTRTTNRRASVQKMRRTLIQAALAINRLGPSTPLRARTYVPLYVRHT